MTGAQNPRGTTPYLVAERHLADLYHAGKRDRDDYGRGLATAYWVALETLRQARRAS